MEYWEENVQQAAEMSKNWASRLGLSKKMNLAIVHMRLWLKL